MKMFTYIAMTIPATLAFGYSETNIAPKDRISISAMSDHIVLIETSRVEWKPAKSEGGIELRELTVSGTIVEVLRGSSRDKMFTHICQDFTVSSEDAYKKANGGASPPDFLHGSPRSGKTGAAELKVGLRYLAIYFRDNVFFVPVMANDETWRSKILELQSESQIGKEPKPAQTIGDKPPN